MKLLSASLQAGEPQPVLPKERLIIHQTGTSKLRARTTEFCAEIADEALEWSRGLMFREKLAPNTGMLFLYQSSDYHSMWMKNTSLSLDIFFIDATGTIITIARNTKPFSSTPITPEKPVTAVLELAADSAKKFGIKPGDSVHHRIFGQNMPNTCKTHN